MKNKMFVGNLSFSVDEASLKSFVESKGFTVGNVQVIRDKYTERSRGFGFVELGEGADVARAIESLNGADLDGRALTVNEARERQPRFESAGGSSYGNQGGSRGDFRRNESRGRRW
jgi:RNA recognition motif-containing protein